MNNKEKTVYVYTALSMLETLSSLGKKYSVREPLRRMWFNFEYLDEFDVKFDTALGYETWA